MKINRGVEWAAHACTLLAALPKDWTLNADNLATYYDVPAAYMAKQMQALSRAGLIRSVRGGGGGYSLLKPPHDISLLDIYLAIEGHQPVFRCMEIRQNGPCPANKSECKMPCGIATMFHNAEQVFRDSLDKTSLADIILETAKDTSEARARDIYAWISTHAFQPKP